MSKLGPYSKEIRLAKVDFRTREGRLLLQMRRTLAEHLGGDARLTATQRVLIERAAYLQLRTAKLDERLVNGSFTDFDGKQYLAWVAALKRVMIALGLERAKPKPLTMAEAIAKSRAERTRESAA